MPATLIYRDKTIPGASGATGATGAPTKGAPLTNLEIDNNFYNLTTEIDTKLGATGYTAADVLTKIKTVDGAGSGLDADTVDGLNPSTNYTGASGATGASIVARDSSGNFSAGTITATFSGNISNGTGSFSTLTASGNTTLSNTLTVNSSVGTTTQFLKSRGAGSSPTWGAVVLTTDVSGTLPIGSGGTGAITAADALTNIVGFTPVQQGTGPGQSTSAVKIGWDSVSRLLLQVDSSNFGSAWPITSIASTNVLGGALGSIPYQTAANTTSLLSPNTTSNKRFLRQTGTGTVGAAPAWDTVTATDVGLGNATNESKATMFTSPTFTGIPKSTHGATGITTDQIATAKFVADSVDAALPTVYKSGMVMQTVSRRVETKQAVTFATAGALGSLITELDTSITPLYSTSRVLVQMNISFEVHHDTVFILYRNGTQIGRNSLDNNYWSGTWLTGYDNDNSSTPRTNHYMFLDSPSTTSAITYRLMIQSAGCGAQTFYLNRAIGNVGTQNHEVAASTVLLQEIK
jgi:hypothetical protein